VLGIPVIIVLMAINIAILYIIDFKRKKYKITNYVLLSLVAVFSIHLSLNYINSKKEIEQRYISGRYIINLYKDKTYDVIATSHHIGCHYLGKYNFENNYLILSDEKIAEKTDSQISTKYKFNREEQTFESLEIGFPNLIKEIN